MHGTSIERALSIVREGGIRPGPGICGEGIYGFAVTEDTPEAIQSAFARCGSGGYNRGAGFLLEPAGLLIKANSSEVVPAGAVSYREKVTGTQYSAHPASVRYVAAVFDIDGLVHALGTHLDQIGYTAQMHAALSRAKAVIQEQRRGAWPQVHLI